jgi:glutathione synthase/RimK-type ligase-like ATP-grasp enzyme
VPVILPAEVQKDCLKTMKLLDLNYAGMDIRKNSDGQYVFIETNPAPMFINFEKATGYRISKALCDALIAGH